MNINEIARLAGVSRATVSRYLNEGYVSLEKRERIKKVIDETGYIPSSQAQTLRTKKTGLIGVIIPKINSESVSRMVAGISVILSEKGYMLLLANTDNDEREELKYLNLFKENYVDGIILIGTIFTDEHMDLMKKLNVPVVVLSQQIEEYACVYFDDYGAAKELTSYMSKTAKEMAYIGVTEKDKAAGFNRKRGYMEAIKSAGLNYNVKYIVEADFSIEAGYNAARKLFKKKSEIDSIVCATDSIAIGAMMYLEENGYKVPEDVQIGGIGDTKTSQVTQPKLTTVHFYYKTSGMEAAKILMNMLEMNLVKSELKTGYELKIHDSTR